MAHLRRSFAKNRGEQNLPMFTIMQSINVLQDNGRKEGRQNAEEDIIFYPS